MVHQSATKKRIIFGLTIFLESYFADYQKKSRPGEPGGVGVDGDFILFIDGISVKYR